MNYFRFIEVLEIFDKLLNKLCVLFEKQSVSTVELQIRVGLINKAKELLEAFVDVF